jgi:hypothetical protein
VCLCLTACLEALSIFTEGGSLNHWLAAADRLEAGQKASQTSERGFGAVARMPLKMKWVPV